MIIDLLRLFWIFCKIGMFTIGGGMAMIPLIQQELVDRNLMTLQESIDMVAISQMTPGPFGVNCATFSGMRLYGLAGAVVATLALALPSFIICLLVSRWFFKCKSSPELSSILLGIKPIVLALILTGLFSIGMETIFPYSTFASIDIPVVCIAAVLSVLMIATKFSPALLVLAAGVFGAIFLR